jgi:DMSO/TMAO reductase YedYZ molybdopterin-dependent catalytic subunit
MMTADNESRRQLLKAGVGAGLVAATAGFPWFALAQGERLMNFVDVPEGYAPAPRQPGRTHIIDTRQIDSFYSNDFYVVQHYGQPELDVASYKLDVTGLVNRELSFTLDQLRALPGREIDAGFECGGNGNRMFHGLVGNARWRGVSLPALLEQAGVQPAGREVVFFGGDVGTEEIRGRQVEKVFARSLSLEDAMRPDNMVVYEMNGQPLPVHHGRPVRLLIPGFYGVANVKWLTQIHIQDTRYMGRFMGRDYVTLKREMVGNQERWVENSVARMNLKSVVVRVTQRGNMHRISGFVLNDGTPLQSVEISIDGGAWQQANIDPQASQYSWKPFHFDWSGASPGEHTVVSRATDINGHSQAIAEDLPERVSYWEEFGQFPRRVMIEA